MRSGVVESERRGSWRVVNQLGNIGPGASGSALIDQNNHLVGSLTLGRTTSDTSGYGTCPASPPAAPNGSNGVADFTSLAAVWNSTADTTSNTGIRYFYVPLVCGTGNQNSPVHVADQIHAPVLLIHGDRDTEVPTEQSLKMQEALRKTDGHVELLVIAGGDHGFKGEQAKQAWAAVTKFLSLHLGSRE